MLFNSLQFLFFFPTVVFLYYAVPHHFRWALRWDSPAWCEVL
jgi:hypothetical protein